MLQNLGRFIDCLLLLGAGALACFLPHSIVKKDGTPEQVAKRVRLLKRVGAGVMVIGALLLIGKLIRIFP